MALTNLAAKRSCSDAEWETRVELAALYRILARFRMTDFIFTHLSARVPDAEGHFLINPYGMTFDRVTASSLVKLDFDGNVIDESGAFNQAGFTIHSAVLMARPDVNFVVHVHTKASVAVAAQRDGLLPISQQAALIFGQVVYHDYEGAALDLDERARLGRDLGDKHAMILRNHGLLTCGSTAGEAWAITYLLDTACQIQVAAQAGGAPLLHIPSDVTDRMSAMWRGRKERSELGVREWKAVGEVLADERADYAR